MRRFRGLAAALASGHPALPVYVLDDVSPGRWRLGGASRWWLHHSLASLGADLAQCAAPLVRVFNPVSQGERFDPEGIYVGKWVPELAKLPGRRLHARWTAPADALAKAGIVLGQTYPKPFVDLAEARALDAHRRTVKAAPAQPDPNSVAA